MGRDRDDLERFATLSLDGSGLARRPRVAERHRAPAYLERFDASTLWLDAVWTGRAVTLICPRLGSLRTDLKGARFALDGEEVWPRMRHYYRHTVIQLPCAARPDRVSVTFGDWRGETAVTLPDPVFAGKRVLITLSKDNALEWVEDWARFHVFHQGAEAAVFVDNGSEAIDPGGIAPALRRGGLQDVRVLTTSVPFGPRGKRPYRNTELFLQTCVLNTLRLRFLTAARSVLSCDLDEMVVSDGQSVFEQAEQHPLGYARIPGYWVHPAPGTTGFVAHARHGFRDDPPKPCPPKWCIVPNGPLRRWQWGTHGLEWFPAALVRPGPAHFFHCRAVNTGWKSGGRAQAKEATVPDETLRRAMTDAGMPQRDA